MRIDELARRIGAELHGDGAVEVSSVSTLEDAEAGQLSFLANPKYARQLETTRASAVIVGLGADAGRLPTLRAKQPHFAFTQAMVALHGFRKHPHEGVHAKAHVENSAIIGEGTVIYPGAYVGANVKIGRDCVLYPNVVIYENCVLGDRVVVHAGSVIGEDGFGYSTHKGEHHKIPQIGRVVIHDDVEIGANCAIDRAALGQTVIGKGTKIGNLNNIAHGTKIGPHGLIVGLVGIAGSVQIGHHATIAGQVGIAGHLKLGDSVTIGAQAGVMNDIPDQTTVIGAPAMPAIQARRVYSIFTQLPELLERIKKLEQQIGELGSADDGSEVI